MRNIGNGYEQTEFAVFQRQAVNRIVEVFCIGAVDRHKRNITKVYSISKIGLRYRVRETLNFFLCFFGELVGKIEFTNRDFCFHSRLVDRSQNFDYVADRTISEKAFIFKFGHDDLRRRCA